MSAFISGFCVMALMEGINQRKRNRIMEEQNKRFEKELAIRKHLIEIMKNEIKTLNKII